MNELIKLADRFRHRFQNNHAPDAEISAASDKLTLKWPMFCVLCTVDTMNDLISVDYLRDNDNHRDFSFKKGGFDEACEWIHECIEKEAHFTREFYGDAVVNEYEEMY